MAGDRVAGAVATRSAPRPRCPVSAFAMDSRRSPRRICGRHFVHQCANGRIRTRAARAQPFRAVRPSATEPLAMPPSTVAGCTTIKAVRHSRDVLASWIQKSRWAELRAFTDTRQRGQLLTKRCPRQIRPIAQRGTTSAVSMRDPAACSATGSTDRAGRSRCGEGQRSLQRARRFPSWASANRPSGTRKRESVALSLDEDTAHCADADVVPVGQTVPRLDSVCKSEQPPVRANPYAHICTL
jgi:hypothetical protein